MDIYMPGKSLIRL